MAATNQPQSQTAANEQERLDRLIDEYEMRREDGEVVSPADICRGHTELIPAFLARLEEVTAANSTLAALARSSSQPDIPGYRIVNELGRGGSAIVYRAVQLEMGRDVAIKVFFPQLQDSGFFEREIAAIKRLTHDGIPAIFDCGRLNFGSAVLCWFSMELLAGGAIDRKAVCQRSTTEILQLFQKTVEAVHYAHLNGVLHRDIKLSNVLLDEMGNPHVADFGIAKLLEEEPGISKHGSVGHMGTPAYTAPELILGRHDQPDVRTEVYSLGVLLFEMLTGHHPFGDNARSLSGLRKALTSQTVPSPASLRTDVSVDLDTFVLKLLSIDPRDRYEACVIVLDEVQRLLNDEPIAARRVGSVERAYRWCRSHYLTTLAALAGAALVLVLLIQLLLSGRQLREYTLQLESRATELSSINDRQSRSVTSSRLRTLQQIMETDRSVALKLLEDEASFPVSRRGFSWQFLHQRASETTIELTDIGGGFDRIQQLEFSASGRHLVVCSRPYDVSVVDLQTHQRISVAEDMQIGSDVVLMPDQSGFLCQNQRKEVLLISFTDGQITNRIVFDEPIRQAMAVTSDGEYLMCLTVDGAVLRYHLESGEVAKSDEGRIRIPVAIWITPDNRQLHVVDREVSWEKWDLDSLTLAEETYIGFPRTSDNPKTLKVRSAAANYQTGFGLCIALSFENGLCMAYWPNQTIPFQAEQFYLLARSTNPLNPVRFRLPNECLIADLEGGKIVPLFAPDRARQLRPREESTCATAVTSDGLWIATGGQTGAVNVVQQKDREPQAHLLDTAPEYVNREFGPPVKTLVLGQSGRVLICHRGGWFSTVEIAGNTTHEAFHLGASRCHLATYSKRHKVALLAFREPDNRIVAIQLKATDTFMGGEKNAGSRTTDAGDGQPVSIFESRFLSRIEEVCLTKDESMFVVALRDGQVVCLDTQTGTELSRWENESPLFKRVTLAAAQDRIISGSHDGWLRWHEIRTGRVLAQWRAHADAIKAISVDHERSILYTASRDGELQSWDFDGVGQQRYVGHADRIQALALSRDGTTLASGGVDHKVIVWDTVSGEKQLVLDAHIGPIVDLSFGEDGFLYSTSLDHAVRVWGSDYATTTTGTSP